MKVRALFGPKDGALRAGFRKRKNALRTAYVRRRRDRLRDTRFVAVTGSGGKTTTSALIGAVLAECGPTYVSLYANTLHGISKRIGNVARSHEFAVFEVGMDAPGGIALSARALTPNVAVLTGIGLDHRKIYRTKEAIAEEKGALFAALGTDDVAVLNADDPLAPVIAARTRARLVWFGLAEGADVRGENIESTVPRGLGMDIVENGKRLRLQTNLIGSHWSDAVLAAVVVARTLGAPDNTIIRAAGAFRPIAGRCSLHTMSDGTTYILDTYKAPYETIDHAIALLRDAAAPRRTAIIGNISDYPGTARTKYQKVYEAARDVAERIIFYGDHAARVRPHEEDVRGGRYFAFEDMAALAAFLADTRQSGEVILVKGAGVDHLERVALHQESPIACWEARCGLPGTCFACDRLRNAPL